MLYLLEALGPQKCQTSANAVKKQYEGDRPKLFERSDMIPLDADGLEVSIVLFCVQRGLPHLS